MDWFPLGLWRGGEWLQELHNNLIRNFDSKLYWHNLEVWEFVVWIIQLISYQLLNINCPKPFERAESSMLTKFSEQIDIFAEWVSDFSINCNYWYFKADIVLCEHKSKIFPIIEYIDHFFKASVSHAHVQRNIKFKSWFRKKILPYNK